MKNHNPELFLRKIVTDLSSSAGARQKFPEPSALVSIAYRAAGNRRLGSTSASSAASQPTSAQTISKIQVTNQANLITL
jgi:hypothetical protein